MMQGVRGAAVSQGCRGIYPVLVGIRNKLGLALSILLGGRILGLLCGMGLIGVVKVGYAGDLPGAFLFLAAIVGVILILSNAQDGSGQSRRPGSSRL